jgi:cycloeucalenol cycloisomerase
MEIAIAMAGILGAMLVVLTIIWSGLTPRADGFKGSWLPLEKSQGAISSNLAKRQFEIFSLQYTGVWIAQFGLVVALKLYETFTADGYMALCVTLAAPFLLQPIFMPMEAEKNMPLQNRYSFKANVWIAIFSFIGNYWYTHYFYTVLKAKYTMPSWRLNDVPIPLYFATHFYFVTYHTFSNLILRKIETSFAPTLRRSIFFWGSVACFAYFTAFMETLTISSYPCYYFENQFDAFTVGSAFYGIYFLVSFPVFYRLDEKVGPNSPPHTLYQTVFEALGAGMAVLCLLDFCRLAKGVQFKMRGKPAFRLAANKCAIGPGGTKQ